MARGKPFEPGNKLGKGRPLGSCNKKTIFQEALETDGVKIIQKIKLQALKANPVAMRLCMERLVPLAKEPNSRFRLPAVETAADLTEAISPILTNSNSSSAVILERFAGPMPMRESGPVTEWYRRTD